MRRWSRCRWFCLRSGLGHGGPGRHFRCSEMPRLPVEATRAAGTGAGSSRRVITVPVPTVHQRVGTRRHTAGCLARTPGVRRGALRPLARCRCATCEPIRCAHRHRVELGRDGMRGPACRAGTRRRRRLAGSLARITSLQSRSVTAAPSRPGR
jgi:hypothetical protein